MYLNLNIQSHLGRTAAYHCPRVLLADVRLLCSTLIAYIGILHIDQLKQGCLDPDCKNAGSILRAGAEISRIPPGPSYQYIGLLVVRCLDPARITHQFSRINQR